jgi:NitT/TauT family transport system ATP-binding protein
MRARMMSRGDKASLATVGGADVVAQSVSKSFQVQGRTVQALSDVSLRFEPGSFVSIVGRSGCGKSTLLRILCGLTNPTSGTVSVSGQPVTAPPRQMRYLFQDYAQSLLPWKTVEANIEFGARHPCTPAGAADPATRRAVVERSLKTIGLTHTAKRYPWELSGGMQQRVAIGRLLAADAQILLMDEPFSAVDALSRAHLQDVVLRLWEELQLTIVLVTHDIDEAVYLSERVIVVNATGNGIDADVAIDLPRPRAQVETRELPAYLDLRRRLLRLVLD